MTGRGLEVAKNFIENIRTGNYSAVELTLAGICLFFAGIIIGMLISPSKTFIAGSFNGNQKCSAKLKD